MKTCRVRSVNRVKSLPTADRNPVRRIYYLHPLMVGPAGTWGTHLERCRALGFDHVAIPSPFAPGASGDVFLAGDLELAHPLLVDAADGCPGLDLAITKLAAVCAAHELALLVDVVLDRVHAGGRV